MPGPQGSGRGNRRFHLLACGDILHFEQHQAGEERFYLARVECDVTGFEFDLKDFPKWFAPIAEQFSIRWRITSSNYRPRVAIFVSKYDHCLVDLLYRQRIGELACEIPLMISNHPDARPTRIFMAFPITSSRWPRRTSRKRSASSSTCSATTTSN